MTERAALPLTDYDHLAVGDLAHRIRSLDAPDLETLLGFERRAAVAEPGWARVAVRELGADDLVERQVHRPVLQGAHVDPRERRLAQRLEVRLRGDVPAVEFQREAVDHLAHGPQPRE